MSSKNSYLDLMKNKADKMNTVRFDHENEDETVTLSYYDGEEWRELSNLGSGGGQSGSLGKGSLTSTFDKKVVQSDEDVIIDYFYSSPNGNGVLYVILNNNQFLKENIGEGSGEVNLGRLPKGTNIIRIYVIDKAGTYTDALQYSIACGTLEITCGFNADRDYYPESNIVFQFNVECVNNEEITYHITQNGKEITDHYKVNKGWNAFSFPKYGPGIYRVEMWCTTASYTSNKISFVIYILAGDSLFISTTFDKEEVPEGEPIKFDYRISMKDQNYFDCVYYIDNVERKSGRVRSGTDFWNITDLPMGGHTIKIVAFTVDKQYSATLEYEIVITESEFELVRPVTTFIKAWFDASTKSNSDSNKELWVSKYPDIYGNYATATLHGFNFSSNGWIDNKLKCDGNAYVEIDLKPFENNVAAGGLTIDILYETADVGNQDARVLDCTDVTTVAGCYIDTQYAHIDTKGGTTLKSAFSENTLTRVTFVVNRDSTYISQENDVNKYGKELPNPMIQIYVNGVLSEIGFLSDSMSGSTVYFENIDHNQKIYINSRKGLDSFGSCSIRHLRIYDSALSHEDVLRNHIADIEDPVKQQEQYRINFDDENPVMPVMRINTYGSMNPAYDISKISKSNKIPVSISYQAIDQHGGSSFELEYCLLQWQGTSTLQYAVKNYKISLYENNSVPIIKKEDSNEEYDKFDFNKETAVKYKYQLFGNDSIGEYKFTLKADYMDSAMCNNTGMASFVGGNLYDSKVPPAKYDSRIRSCCKGYPFLLYIDGEYAGIYNFMIDKGAEDTFGFKRPKDKISSSDWEKEFPCVLGYEGAANSDNTAGAFVAWTPETGVDLNTWYSSDFELRYPEDEHDSYEEIHRLVNFIDKSSDEEFVGDFEQYINKDYCESIKKISR